MLLVLDFKLIIDNPEITFVHGSSLLTTNSSNNKPELTLISYFLYPQVASRVKWMQLLNLSVVYFPSIALFLGVSDILKSTLSFDFPKRVSLRHMPNILNISRI